MTVVPFEVSKNLGGLNVVWSGLTTDDTGAPVELVHYADRTIQIFGDFGSNGVGALEGSNDPRVLTDAGNAVWFPVLDPFEDAVSVTAAGAKVLLHNPRFLRPKVTLGTDPAITFIISCKKD